MRFETGLDQLDQEGWRRFDGRSIAILCHQASVTDDLVHLIESVFPKHQAGDLEIRCVFGPQHGPWGHTQDNMIEWEGYEDPRTGLRFFSLYGETRKPTPAMLDGVEHLVIDLFDVGARYYTFIWTMAHCLEACADLGIPVTILDRPNPLGGTVIEGPGHDPAFSSFVGLYSLPVRHGLTIGEVARHINHSALNGRVMLDVVQVYGWHRAETALDYGDWVNPSPNMPSARTAFVYPGQCLLEGTNLSEGRGTTRPFEQFGAPWIDGFLLAESVNRLGLPGLFLRPVSFQPGFQKHAGELCHGATIHITDHTTFEPVLTTIAILQESLKQSKCEFGWKQPPYEYEYEKLPFDILAGGTWVREAIEAQTPLSQIRERMASEAEDLVRGYRIRG